MKKNNLILLLILFIGLLCRLYGNNWDQGWHLHPDERFLTMVGIDVQIPSTLSNYLDAHTSTFNPTNRGHEFYVYGTLPVLMNKILAQQLYSDTYDQFNLLGRTLSGLADFLIILVIYRLVSLVEKKLKLHHSIKFLSAFFYAIAVLPIQLSHFFAVDTFLNLFVFISLYYAVKIVIHKSKGIWMNTILSGLFIGLALACKISALYVVPLILLCVSAGYWWAFPNKKIWMRLSIGIAVFTLFAYGAVRLGSPYYFETASFLNPQLNSIFINSIKTLKSYDNPEVPFPPANQWIHASPFLSATNLIFFGVGPIYFLFALLGLAYLLRRVRQKLLMASLLWVIVFTVYQSVQFAKTMRYLIFIYPFIAFFCGLGIYLLFKRIKLFPVVLSVIAIIVWPLAFMSIYTKDHSRVTASKWMYHTFPYGSTVLTEYWDDPLPLMVQDPTSRNYQIKEVHIFDPDSQQKWDIINNQLKHADYYVMSSNRGWGSIPTTPEKYPMASAFYAKMLKGKGSYSLVKEFSSYPSLRYLGIPIDFPDQWSEEAFTVYDHPLVYVFKKNR